MDAAERLTAEIALVSDQELLAMIEEAIKDELRIGTPVTFSAEQVTQIIALACSEPLASGRPISHGVPGNCGRSNQTRDCRNNFDPLGRAFFKKKPI